MIKISIQWLCGTVLIISAWYLLWRFVIERGHVGPPVVARETTWVDGPVRPGGYIDYHAALNEFDSRNVAPEENAGINLLRAIGPQDDECDPFVRRWQMLTADVPAANRSDFDISSVACFEHPPKSIWSDLKQAETRPWKSDEFPDVSAWMLRNADSLRYTRDAASQPYLWLPAIPSSDNVDDLDNDCDDVFFPVPLCRALLVSAMNHLALGEVNACQDDLLAVRRLESLLTRSAGIMPSLPASSIAKAVFKAETTLLSAPMTRAELERYAARMRELTDIGTLAETVAIWNRMRLLAEMQRLHREHNGDFDIHAALGVINDWLDRRNTVWFGNDDGSSTQWVTDFMEHLHQQHVPRARRQLTFTGRRSRGEAHAVLAISQMALSYESYQQMCRGLRARRRVIETGLAVRLFYHDTQQIPHQLDELVPRYLRALPDDELQARHLVSLEAAIAQQRTVHRAVVRGQHDRARCRPSNPAGDCAPAGSGRIICTCRNRNVCKSVVAATEEPNVTRLNTSS